MSSTSQSHHFSRNAHIQLSTVWCSPPLVIVSFFYYPFASFFFLFVTRSCSYHNIVLHGLLATDYSTTFRTFPIAIVLSIKKNGIIIENYNK